MSHKRKVYLCGGINALPDSEAMDWREAAKALLGDSIDCLNPMRRDYRGRESVAWTDIVRGDLEDVAMCDCVLVNACRASWGTAMEIVYARVLGKPIVIYGAGERPSPWLIYHATALAEGLQEACELVRKTLWEAQ